MKILVDMSDKFVVGECSYCPQIDACTDTEGCPFIVGKAVEAVEVNQKSLSEIGTGNGEDMYDGEGMLITLYAVRKQEGV